MRDITTNGGPRWLLFDWGDTVMRVFPEFAGPMYSWPRVEAVAGIREVLTGLQPKWRFALATNAADSEEREIRAALARVGLDMFFDRVYCFRTLGHRKSTPRYFEHVLDDLGILPDHAVMVGDDFETDILGANRSGIRAIWLHANGTGEKRSSVHRTIHHLSELPEALGRLLGERSRRR